MIVINSYETAVAMLDKKGTIYSDRPLLPMLGELGGWNKVTTFLRNRKILQFHRRIILRMIGSQSSIQRFHSTLEESTHKLLRRILDRPQSEVLEKHIKQ